MRRTMYKKPSSVKTSDTTKRPRRKGEYWLFGLSGGLLIVSLAILVMARSIATEHTRVPFAGIAPGIPVTNGVSTVTVRNIRHCGDAKPFTAPDGHEYLVLTLRVRNNSEKPVQVFPTTDTYIKTSTGAVSYLTPYVLANPFHSGTILPGESTEGELSYLVPKNTPYKFYVEAGWSGGVVPFMLQSTDNHKQDTR